MAKHPFRASALAALALGLAGAGAAHAGKLVPMFKRERPSARAVPHIPAPRISIAGAKAVLQSNCGSPRPLFLAYVTLHNAGGPLAANRGLASVSDSNRLTYRGQPLRLVSHGIQLPAVGPNADATVTVPVVGTAPYAGEVGEKTLTVRVLPTTYSRKPAFSQPPVYVFSATVPRGFCARAGVSRAAAGRLAPSASERTAPHISFGSKAPPMSALVRPQPLAAGRSSAGQKRRLGGALTIGGIVKVPPCAPLGAGSSPGKQTFARLGGPGSAPARTPTKVQAFPMLGAVGDTVPLKAVLKTAGTNKPVPYRSLIFTVGGDYAGRAKTDKRGMARLQYVVPNKVGHRLIRASFAGNSACSRSHGIANFSAIRAATRIEVADNSISTPRRGGGFGIRGMLKRVTDGSVIRGREVLIYLDGKEVSSQTDSETFYQSFPLASNAPDRIHVKVLFKGDRLYLPTSAELTEKILPAPVKAYLTWPAIEAQEGQIVTVKMTLSKRYPSSSHSGIAGRKIALDYKQTDTDPGGGYEYFELGDAVTNASGVATIRFKVDVAPGSYEMGGNCVQPPGCDDLTLEDKSVSRLLHVTPAAPAPVASVVLYVSGPTTGSVGSIVKFNVLVKRSTDGAPAAGVNVDADGELISTTGKDGRATVYYRVPPYVGSGVQDITFHAQATTSTQEGSKQVSFKATPSTS